MAENNATFESNIARLEEIINMLEKGEASLDECINLFEDGVKISKDCMEMLDKAEQKIRLLTVTEGENYTESDFVADGEWTVWVSKNITTKK